ncbi:hypothetical protein KKB18_04845 [bacterium]|nr:hypothetical protein [bacterium]
MKKRELLFVVIFIISFMFTITWVYTYKRSKDEYFKGKAEQDKILKAQKVYNDALSAFKNREPNREERKELLNKQKNYYQTITRAVTAYDTSIHSYTPFNIYVGLSIEMLDEIGEFCAKEGEYQLAFNIFETIKISPLPQWVEKANKKSDEVYEQLNKQKKSFIEEQKEKDKEKEEEASSTQNS